jgi:hypothetical protein
MYRPNQFIPGGLHAAEIEFGRWKQHWQRQPAADSPRAVLYAVQSATKLGTYPIMCELLRIMAPLPVTTAMGAFKYIKTYAYDRRWGKSD